MHQNEESAAQPAKSSAALWAVIITSVAEFMASSTIWSSPQPFRRSARISVARWRTWSGR